MTTLDPTVEGALPETEAAGRGNHPPGTFRVCATTGLTVDLAAEKFIKINAVFAVVFLLLGGIAALLLALTRWSAVHLLNAEWYYRMTTFHGLNMLILWILFMEIGILYFAATALLKSRLASVKAGWAGFACMAVGAIMLDAVILAGKADVMMTSYVPLRAHPTFYLAIILVAVGTLIGVINFLATVYIAKRDKTYSGSVPLVVFGAITAAIIAVSTLLHGAGIMIPTFLWSIDVIDHVDPAAYRLVWWGLGHQSQQVNVAAMVSVWYLLGTLTVGAKVLNQGVSRTAFLLYILFINLASAHHLLVDPGVSAGWKIWNTSYAMYLAVLASMIHGYTVPAAVEVALRKQGHTKGLFGWLGAAPWKNPGFSGFFLSLLIFGFIGGITGVTLGTEQINIIAHNTLRIPGHFHATVVGGTSLAFMALAYYVVPLIFRREFPLRWMCRAQPYVFAAGIVLMSLGMSFAGSYGVSRRSWDVEASGALHPVSYDPSVHVWLGVLGIGGSLAFVGLLMFVVPTVLAVFFGKRVEAKMPAW
ncbi:MAG: cbb3-type cytochrome c oxidase subunit I [Polyangiaceae bacterium]|nr:cbb3-type cytochrome c oxidase subunit I [Polyangiaceae bacterium]